MKRSALVIATLGAFLTPFMGSAINVALPSIQTEFPIGLTGRFRPGNETLARE